MFDCGMLKEAERHLSHPPYDLDEPGEERDAVQALMKLTEQALSKYDDGEPDLY